MANNLHLLGKTTVPLLCLFLCLLQSSVTLGKKEKDERECEVCIATIEKFKKEVPDEMYGKVDKLESAFRKFCKKIPKGGKENRFCYFVGGTEDAATGILGNLIKPLSYHLPAEKICDKLKAMDAQICEMRFDVKPDFTKLNKMRVGELKKILSNWGEDSACKGCAEKSEFIKKVRELMPKHEPEEWKKLQALEKEL
ncbi:mesencephalic astrocyte-derived neurotrophic factor homolog [Physella acuta]|uniref:mesencephalic astrocyte-derived neurotrophic factor homolog n=1 Tax=Physella acuta TaxID=109671 RepID=UPI0027DD61E2|nr:mesencephalic astrocyte-derived neurotrophic factor homolog [Physella acuta]XP_059172452.1 mesencephalic astrocyte-derived neurotrophic factor homolog [Physella acuta]XP_059172453.1 mesencephalic astrocyte-derived neurotrophic factor homolog [Physella acuta]XP_059172454.1 mesencephalic astrocyte-derived neurotrophic factor homolog [Physella acuta]